MKFRKVSLFFALLLAVCITGVAQEQLRVNIPFNFSAGKTSLPAGHYRVAPVDDKNQMAWLVSNERGAVMVLTNSVESPGKAHPPSLVFLHADTGYSLIQIWPSEHSGLDLLLKSKVTTIILSKVGKYVEIGAE
ncbi:MAG: hypothetical protein ACYDDS_20345 [Candidatus Sulfotelmatobacter sp.]